MSMRQADLLEYYLKNVPEISDASVDERTGNATIRFSCSGMNKVSVLQNALRDYDENSDQIAALVPEETGRKLNREYQEKLLFEILKHNLCKILLPAPLAHGRTILKSIPYAVRAIRSVVSGRLKVEALDGIVLEGEMTVNQSSMTGEAVAVPKRSGGYVYAGTVVEEGECRIKVTREAGSGKYDQIVRMIEESEKLKSDTEANAYRLADSLVPYSFAGFAATMLLSGNISKALSFLMVDYSCAMKLSMPLAVLSAIREARDYGVSIKGGKFMELVSEADTIVFDKTGTLTYATPKLMEVIPFGGEDPDEMLRIAACLEEHYPHSIANAVIRGAQEKELRHDEIHSKVEYIVAHGVSSYIGEKKTVIGSYHFVMEDEGCHIPKGEGQKLEMIPEAYSRLYLAIDGVLVAVLCIFDPVREEAEDVIGKLHDLGFKHICMMTGDNHKTAENVAGRIGLDEYQAEVLPQQKADYVKKKREMGHKVIMVGDGVNDSPALSEADVGIAVDTGAAIARQVADITVSSESLNEIVALKKISNALMKRIHSNYRFIVGFNSTLIALGLMGIISPASSALLHNGSTIFAGVKSTTTLLKKKEEM